MPIGCENDKSIRGVPSSKYWCRGDAEKLHWLLEGIKKGDLNVSKAIIFHQNNWDSR